MQAGSDRPCPQPNVVQTYLQENADFTGDISNSDRVCFTCYKSHLALLKQNIPTRNNEDLKAQVQSVRASVDKGSDIVHGTTNRMLLYIGTMLLDNRPSLLPIICSNVPLDKMFQCTIGMLAVAKGVEEPAELKLAFNDGSYVKLKPNTEIMWLICARCESLVHRCIDQHFDMHTTV